MFGEELDAIRIKGQATCLNEIFEKPHAGKQVDDQCSHSHKATEVNESRQDFNDIFKVLSFSSQASLKFIYFSLIVYSL